MQRQCHGCDVISDVEDRPFTSCPACGLPYGSKPIATPTPITASTTRDKRRKLDVRPDLPAERKRWFSPQLLSTLFWVFAAVMVLPTVIGLFVVGLNSGSVAALVFVIAITLAARVSIEVVLAIFAIAESTEDAQRSLRILIRAEADRQE